jgi:phenylacetic acid degradation operon negative regulatory protein
MTETTQAGAGQLDRATPGGQPPTLLRRHAAGTESARSVLFTVLGELVLPTGGEAWTSAFIDVLGRLGIEEKAARQALMRTAADNWLSSERVGRRTVWRLTPAAERLLRDGTERIFSFTAVAGDWDGRWTIVIARTPETERAARHMVRTRLRWAGFGTVSPAVRRRYGRSWTRHSCPTATCSRPSTRAAAR